MSALMISFKKWLATSSQKQKYTAALFAFGLLSTFGLMLMQGTQGTMDDPLQASPFYFIGVFAKLAVVLLLILACSVIFRRWSQPGLKGNKKRQMQVIETVRLSPKQAVHLVVVGDHQLLIGATDQSVSLLTPVALDLHVPETQVEPPAVRTDFASLLQAINFRPPVETSGKDQKVLL
jgi:flagellar biosynthetic protein FliO